MVRNAPIILATNLLLFLSRKLKPVAYLCDSECIWHKVGPCESKGENDG